VKNRLIYLLWFVSFNAMAADNPFSGLTEGVIGWFEGGLAVSLAVLSCIIIGVVGFFSRWSKETIIGWCIAACLVFGSRTIVSTFQSFF
jgi:type IV secretory pathway VirB2 component (pilin)